MKIIHLTDLHLSKDKEHNLTEYLMPALINKLNEENKDSKIDLIMFTGDAVDKGAETYGNLTEGLNKFNELFLTPLMSELSLTVENIYFTMGNHDTDKEAIDSIAKKGIKGDLINEESINDFIHKYRLIEDKYLANIKAFKDFEKKFYDGISIPNQITNFDSSFILNNDNIKIGISSFNSSWRCVHDNDKENLIIGERQVFESQKFIKDTQYKIALIHHPIDWLMPEDCQFVEAELSKSYDLILSGHVHKETSKYNHDIYGKTLICIGTNIKCNEIRDETRKYSVGFEIIDVNFETRKVKIEFLKYNHKKNQFVLNTDEGDLATEGYMNLDMVPETQVTQIFKEEGIIKHIQVDKYNEMNQHLISYGTDTKAPKELDRLFVFPIIRSNPVNDYSVSQKIERDYLLYSTDNVLISGRKEIGKTTLLDKLIIETSRNYSTIKKIPVYINMQEMGNKEVIQIVRDYLLLNPTDVREYIEKKRIVLFIDNLSFIDSFKPNIKKIFEFYSKYKIRIVATIEQSYEAGLPPELMEYPDVLFNLVYIKPFEGDQIRELIGNWFQNSKDEDFQDKLENLINNLRSFAMPRTPLAITMFLWLIEKQEYNPINKSSLLQKFIEGVLERFRPNELFSKTFDFDNKVDLLSSIAEKMLEGDNNNYSMTYDDLLSYINEYLADLSMDKLYNSEEILNGIINSTLMKIDSNNEIRFRFPIYFEFFLAKRMEKDHEFKNKVLSKEHLESFVNEIDYYTGLHRDEEPILEMLFNVLSKEFSEINNAISKIDVDMFFEIEESIFANHDIKQLPHGEEKKEKIRKYYDEVIERLPVKEDITKKNTGQNRLSYGNILGLTSKVLKNLEGVKNEELRFKTYKLILKCSTTMFFLYKFAIIDHIVKYDKIPNYIPKGIDLNAFMGLIPIFNQLNLFIQMGSFKLAQIVNRKIEEDLENSDITEFEQFASIFIFADIRARDYFPLIKKFSKKAKKTYILDSIFFKVLSYYHLRTFDKKEKEKMYENLLADLKIQIKGISKENKALVLKNIREGKKKSIKIKQEDKRIQKKIQK